MQKIRNRILDRMVAEKLTDKEICFLLYISRFQDNSGRVSGVHYKDVCKALRMSYQGFYDVKARLEEKGFISCEKKNRIDHDIVILDNEYTGEEYNKAGYMNTNHNIFFCGEFYKLRAGAKLLALQMMKNTYSGKGYFMIGVGRFYDKKDGYQRRFQVSIRVMRSYLMEIKSLFSIGIKNGRYYIEPKEIIRKRKDQKTEAARLREYYTEVVMRRNRIRGQDADKKEICGLFYQYSQAAAQKKKDLLELIDGAVKKSLEILNEGERWIKNKSIEIKLIHNLLKKAIANQDEGTGRNGFCGAAPPSGNRNKEYQKNEKNRFHNFPQRSYDYDELEQLLLFTHPAE